MEVFPVASPSPNPFKGFPFVQRPVLVSPRTYAAIA
jgi:hypothetical protein